MKITTNHTHHMMGTAYRASDGGGRFSALTVRVKANESTPDSASGQDGGCPMYYFGCRVRGEMVGVEKEAPIVKREQDSECPFVFSSQTATSS